LKIGFILHKKQHKDTTVGLISSLFFIFKRDPLRLSKEFMQNMHQLLSVEKYGYKKSYCIFSDTTSRILLLNFKRDFDGATLSFPESEM